MKSNRLVLILSPLALAGAAAVMWPSGNDEVAKSRVDTLTRGPLPRSPDSSHLFGEEFTATVDELVEPSLSDVSAERIAIRLAELTEALGLTSDQRREVKLLLTRSAESYEPVTRTGATGEPLARLTQVRAQEGIHELLDPLQQAAYEDLLLDDQLWWAEVIDRLERDLKQATDPVEDFTEPAASKPPAPPSHRGGNIFDLLNPPEP